MIEVNNKTKSAINLKAVKRITDKFLKLYKKEKQDVSIAFVGDAVMRKLNKVYRGKDKVTDILSFPNNAIAGKDKGKNLGEIIISFAQIKRQAKKYGNSAEKELAFILAHGLLHLVGMEDESEKGRKRMEEAGEEFVKNYLKF